MNQNTSNDNDVLTLLKLYEMATTPDMREARMWLLAEFDARDYETFRQRYPVGSREWHRFNGVCSIMELFGVLVKRRLVDEEIFFDLFGGVDILWESVAAVMPGMRQAIDSRLYENFEWLHQRARTLRQDSR